MPVPANNARAISYNYELRCSDALTSSRTVQVALAPGAHGWLHERFIRAVRLTGAALLIIPKCELVVRARKRVSSGKQPQCRGTHPSLFSSPRVRTFQASRCCACGLVLPLAALQQC